MSDRAGAAKPRWLFWKGFLFRHFSPIAGQRPFAGRRGVARGGETVQNLCNLYLGWVLLGGCGGRGARHASLPRVLYGNVSPCLQIRGGSCLFIPQPGVFLSSGPAARVCRVCVCVGGCISESLFFCPHGCFGLRGAVAGSRGRARSGLRWHSRAVAINRNLLTRITTAGHGALGPLMQLLRATDSATAEPHGAATLDAKSSGAAFYFDFSAELLNRNALKQRGGGGGEIIIIKKLGRKPFC